MVEFLNLDTTEFVETMLKKDSIPEGTAYVASDPDLEKLPLFKQLQTEVYGDVPIEFGYCNGRNNKLNAVEYHRCSEIDIAATDLILMLGLQQDINYDNNTYETSKNRAILHSSRYCCRIICYYTSFCSISSK